MTASRAARIEAADAIAARVVEAAPFRLGAAQRADQIEAMQRLRAATVVKMGWAPPEQFPEGLERDEQDARAVHVGAWEGNELVGTSRVIPPFENGGLPLEEEFGVSLELPGEMVEVGRTVIVPAKRGDAEHGLVVAIFAQCWREMRALGFTELVANVPAKLLEVYRGIGFRVEVLGRGREIWGEERFPVRFDVLGSVDALSALSPS